MSATNGAMADHRNSLFGDLDYYNDSRPVSTYSAQSSSKYTSPTHSRVPSTQAINESQQYALRKQPSLAQVAVPSFSAFRSQTSSIPSPSPSSIRRKQLPPQLHSRRAPSLAAIPSPRLVDPSARPLSLDSPRHHQPAGLAENGSQSSSASSPSKRDSLPYTYHRGSIHRRNDSLDSRVGDSDQSSSVYGGDSRRSSIPIHAKYAQEHTIAHAPQQSVSSIDFAGARVAPLERHSMNGQQLPPEMKLEMDGVQRRLTDESMGSAGDSPNNSRPRSPGQGKFKLFGWKAKSQTDLVESPTTTFSDRSISPLPSPHLQTPIAREASASSGMRLTPPGLDILKANGGSPRSAYFENPDTPILIGTPETNAHVKELERELAHVSSELAGSVKREMELEDEIDRLRIEGPDRQLSDAGRRTSDYFSDSGASTSRFPVTDVDAKIEQMERSLRKAEQEKAQVKVEMASRLQTELSRRRDLEQMVQKLEEQLQKKFDEDDEHQDAEERIDELESTLEDTKRLLSQERQAKGSFEDLYSATKEEMDRHRNERDNLRDEIVPGLKARVEGLEVEASDTQALMYENTRMQQELVTLRAKMQGGFGSIAEEGAGIRSPQLNGPRAGLSRSNSLARTQSKRGGSLTRAGSVKERDGGRHRSGSMNGDAVKELEDQRDALHKAVKLLILRCDKQQREHERAVKKLAKAKTRAETTTPNRTAYHKEVYILKEEVAALRKRTEDALEQKWQYEKGLSGIKMDLDRAEMETRGLRIILQEHDILGPSTNTQLGEGDDGNHDADSKIKLSISTAEAERDQARSIADQYRARAQEVDDGSAMELMNSANRMDQLAGELDKQVQSNVQLRGRLADAVAKGEHEQKESNGRIAEMQKRLTVMEDSILVAQQHSETTLGNHEAEVRRMEEASSPALQRLRISIPDPKRLTPNSPLLAKSPKLNGKRLTETSLLEMSRTQMLERKVKEMEGLLREAEEDMHEVVQRVNQSQMEVADLQTERDAAFSQMRKLQALIVEERERAEMLMS